MVQLSEGPVQRGNGKGGPTTPKPPLTPKGQASKGDDVHALTARLLLEKDSVTSEAFKYALKEVE